MKGVSPVSFHFLWVLVKVKTGDARTWRCTDGHCSEQDCIKFAMLNRQKVNGEIQKS